MSNNTKKNHDATAIGAFCKCGGMIYCCSNRLYKSDKDCKREVKAHKAKGYTIRFVTATEIKNHFGCKCPE